MVVVFSFHQGNAHKQLDSFSSTCVHLINNLMQTATISPLQALSDKSIYSIFLPMSQIPTWISHQSESNRVSLQVPPLDSDRKISGFFISTVYNWENSLESCYVSPYITAIHRTKEFHWEYNPRITFFQDEVEEDMMWLSCWFFENLTEGIDDFDKSWRFRDELEEGDLLDVFIDMGSGVVVKRRGIHLFYHHNGLHVSQSDDLLAAISLAHSSKHYRRLYGSHARLVTLDHFPQVTNATSRLLIEEVFKFPGWANKERWRIQRGDYRL